MSDNDKCKSPPSEHLSTGDMPEQKGKDTSVRYTSKPPSRSGRKIHPRTPVPKVPKGEDVPDKTPTPPVDLD